jgi:hypothetical protein
VTKTGDAGVEHDSSGGIILAGGGFILGGRSRRAEALARVIGAVLVSDC